MIDILVPFDGFRVLKDKRVTILRPINTPVLIKCMDWIIVQTRSIYYRLLSILY